MRHLSYSAFYLSNANLNPLTLYYCLILQMSLYYATMWVSQQGVYVNLREIMKCRPVCHQCVPLQRSAGVDLLC
jgi:hypothetical protein